MKPPDAKTAFETLQIDAWAVWPPWVEQEVVDGKGRVLPGGDAKIHSIMAMRGGFVDQYPQLARLGVEVLERSKAWIQSNPQEAQRIVADELKLPYNVIALAWPKHSWTAQLDDAVISDIQAKADFLRDKEQIRESVNVKNDLIKPIRVIAK